MLYDDTRPIQSGPKKRYPGFMLYDDTINVILCLWVNVVWINGFNRVRGLIWAE